MANNPIDMSTFSSTYADWSQRFDPNQVDYSCETQSSSELWRDFLIRVIIFPLGICRVVHGLIGRCFSKAAGFSTNERTTLFQDLHCPTATARQDGYLYKRIRVLVDGLAIDGTMIVHPDTLDKGRWVLYANENHECYEGPRPNSDGHLFAGSFIGIENGEMNHVTHKRDSSFLAQIQANAILFNYPGIGDSDNVLLYRDAMVKAHYAMRRFLEDKEEGIGAQEIICFGSSIGGGIQGDDIAQFPIDERSRYCFIKNKTFSEAENTFSNLLLKLGTWLTGWNISPVTSSRQLAHPEIIVQTIRRPGSVIESNYYDTPSCKSFNPDDIINDGLFPADATLAHALLRDDMCDKSSKHFVGVYGEHGQRYEAQDISLIAELVNNVFEQTASHQN